MTACTFLLFGPTQVKAGTEKSPVSSTATTTVKSTEANALTVRLSEIKAMDKTEMNKTEKKELRKEVRSINSELKVNSEGTYIEGGHGGVYLSVGGLLLIILILVLIL